MTTTKKTTTRKKTSVKKPTAVKAKPKVVTQKIPDLPPNPFVFEVLDAASKMRSKANKIEVLRRYSHNSLKAVFIWNFDETVISLLPEGEVPYGSNIEDETQTGTLSGKINDAVDKMGEMGSNSLGSQDQGKASIRKEFQKFYNFIRGGNDGLSSLRRETMFINILTGLHPREAEILILIKDKRLSDRYNITKEIVSEAYPDITWGGRS
tara:strand:+ start:1048 stop:1674 length:627 start_codon:yes stop_codon:yes gene_type:complete